MLTELREKSTNDGGSGQVFRALAINPADAQVYLPAEIFRQPDPDFQIRGSVEKYGDTYRVTSYGFSQPIFVPETERLVKSLDKPPVDIIRVSKISKASAVLDSLKGVKGKVMDLQPLILLRELSLSDTERAGDDSGFNFLERAIRYKYFVSQNPRLVGLLGLNNDEALDLLFSVSYLEQNLKEGNFNLAEQILQENPRLLTVYLGHETAKLMSGYLPPDNSRQKMSTIMQMFLSRNEEIAPQDLDQVDFITRLEWANVLNVYKDLMFSLTYPRAFQYSNKIDGVKTGNTDPLVRYFKLMNDYDLRALDLPSLAGIYLNSTNQYPNGYSWIEQRPKGTMRMCQKSIAKYKAELKHIFEIHPEVRLMTITNIDNFTLSGFETLLGIENPDTEDLELLARITLEMMGNDDDLAFRAFLKPEDFDDVMADLSVRPGSKTKLKSMVYQNNALAQKSESDISGLYGLHPTNLYRQYWYTLKRQFPNSLIYSMVHYKKKLATEGRGMNAVFQFAPFDKEQTLSSWKTRVLFTQQEN